MARFTGSLQAFLLASILAAGSAGTALAADLPPSLPPPPVIEAPPTSQLNGWYLRGDVGYGFSQISSYSSNEAAVTPGFQYTATGLDGQTIIGGGVGYQINNWFRTDLTAEYRTPTNFSAVESYNNQYGIGGDNYTAHVSNAVVLANGYVDLGTWWGFTPFVGAGVGVAFNQLQGLQDIGYGAALGGYGVAPDSTSTQFAWAAMAGVDYAIAPNWKLELGFRYLDMGDVTSNGIVCTVSCTHEVVSFHMASYDARIGLRYIFAEVPPQLPTLQPPLVSKY